MTARFFMGIWCPNKTKPTALQENAIRNRFAHARYVKRHAAKRDQQTDRVLARPYTKRKAEHAVHHFQRSIYMNPQHPNAARNLEHLLFHADVFDVAGIQASTTLS